MKSNFLIVLLAIFIVSCDNNSQLSVNTNNISGLEVRGADISFLPELEKEQVELFDIEGRSSDLLSILSENANLIIHINTINE